MTSRRFWQAAAAVWACVIVVTGLLPTQGAVKTVSGGREDLTTIAGHFAAYALLGLLLGAALGGWRTKWDRVILGLHSPWGSGG
jgi:hypothetical protein